MMRRMALLIALTIVAPSPARSQDSGIEIRLVPDAMTTADTLTVGDPLWMTVETRGPRGYYLLPQSLIDALEPHVELAVRDSRREEGVFQLELALFRPGEFVVPTVEAAVVTPEGDTLQVAVVSDTIAVASVLAPGDTLLADIKPLWTEGGIPWWVWWLLAMLIAAALLALWWRRRQGASPEERVVAANAYDRAMDRLQALRVDPPTPDRRIAAACDIGDAVRDYLADGWRLSAREYTTLELLPRLPERGVPVRPALASLLSTVDLAKFARLAPEPGAVPRMAADALVCVERLEAVRVPTTDAAAIVEAAS